MYGAYIHCITYLFQHRLNKLKKEADETESKLDKTETQLKEAMEETETLKSLLNAKLAKVIHSYIHQVYFYMKVLKNRENFMITALTCGDCGTLQTEDELQACQKQLSDANEALEKAKEDQATARKESREQSR